MSHAKPNPPTTRSAGKSAKAAGGTLCLLNSLNDQLPRGELIAMLVSLLQGEHQARIVVCARAVEDVGFQAPSLVIPSPSTRKTELDRVIAEYAADAAKRLSCTERVRLSAAERAWIRASAGESISELKKTTLRLVAIRAAGNVYAASQLLSISHQGLAKWLERRAFSKLEDARLQ